MGEPLEGSSFGGPVALSARERWNLVQDVEHTRFFDALREAGDMGGLALRSLRELVRPPFRWLPNAVTESASLLRLCLVPMMLSTLVYVAAFGTILLGQLVGVLGIGDRQPGALNLGVIREVASWLVLMFVAGIAGSSVTADLAARSIREELDALDVLGIDRMRLIVLPRIVAITAMTIVLSLLCIFVGVLQNYFIGPAVMHFPRSIFGESLRNGFLAIDFYASMVKVTIMGFFVAVVSVQKGLSAKGGAEGVGRAVNQTVIITYFGIWLMNSIFNLAFLGTFPEASSFRG